MRVREQELLKAIFNKRRDETVRAICNRVGAWKQNCYYLSKWASKNWYDYGVSLDLGWLTEEGKVVARQLR